MSTPHNVVLIITDQQHYNTLGISGCRWAKTPNIDALASSGICFDNHMVTNPVCSPSRASIMTGLLPSENGLWGNGCRLPVHHPTLATIMNDHGWQTAHFGKLHLVPIITRTEPHPSYGFQTCEVAEGDQQLLDDDYFRQLRRNHPDLFVQYVDEMYTRGHATAYTSVMPEDKHVSTWVTDRSIDWLERRRQTDRPFLLSVGYFDPHHAFNPCEPYASDFADADVELPQFDERWIDSKPDHYRAHYEVCRGITRDPEQLRALIRAYHAMIAHLDKCVGRLVQTLDHLGLLDSTDIIFTSDHGELIGNQGLLWKGPYLLDHLLRVPLIISRPGSASRRISGLSSMLDIVATVQSLAGVSERDWTCGSGKPLVDHQMNPFPQGARDCTLTEWFARPGTPPGDLKCLRTDRWKLVHYNQSPTQGELYDLQSDPGECNNLFASPEHAATKDQLSAQLAAHYLSQRPTTPCEGGW